MLLFGVYLVKKLRTDRRQMYSRGPWGESISFSIDRHKEQQLSSVYTTGDDNDKIEELRETMSVISFF